MLNKLPQPKVPKTGFPWSQETSFAQQHINQLPKISIVTPSYNQGAYLEETMRSVLLQNYPNLEYIVIDGNSTDNSLDIIERYSEFLSHVVSEVDEGQGDAINKGFHRATGDILGWLNSDDILLPGALWTIAEYFESNPESQIITGMRKVYDSESKWRFNWFNGYPRTEQLRFLCTVFQEATFWRRNVWERIGEIDTSFQYALDFDYWLRILDAGYNFDFLPHYLGGFRLHGESKGSTLDNVRRQELRKLRERYGLPLGEAVVNQRLEKLIGADWQQKFLFLRQLGHQPISHQPHVLLWAYQMLFSPLIGTSLVFLYKRYNKFHGRHVYE